MIRIQYVRRIQDGRQKKFGFFGELKKKNYLLWSNSLLYKTKMIKHVYPQLLWPIVLGSTRAHVLRCASIKYLQFDIYTLHMTRTIFIYIISHKSQNVFVLENLHFFNLEKWFWRWVLRFIYIGGLRVWIIGSSQHKHQVMLKKYCTLDFHSKYR